MPRIQQLLFLLHRSRARMNFGHVTSCSRIGHWNIVGVERFYSDDGKKDKFAASAGPAAVADTENEDSPGSSKGPRLTTGRVSTSNPPKNNLNDLLKSIAAKNPEAQPINTIPEVIVDAFPPSVQPYLRLSRMHRPIGTWLLFWPCTWGLGLGAEGVPPLTLLALFGLGAFIMRGAGCTINDMWDRDIDSKVKRTTDRPLAAGQLRMRHALVWLSAQLSIALVILLQLPDPCFMVGVGSLGLVTFYPLAKRVTNWPQGVLGLTFNTGVLAGYTAMVAGQGYFAFPWLDPSCLALYAAGLSWTLVYDTIYAHQDRDDDTLLGLGSTAKKFGDNTKYWLSTFGVTMLSSLTAVGWMEGLNWPYYAGLTATALHLTWQIKTLDIHNSQNCAERFRSNRHIGWIIFLSLVTSYSL